MTKFAPSIPGLRTSEGIQCLQTPMTASANALLDCFVPCPDVRGRLTITVRAPAEFVMDVARRFEIESLWIVRTLFRLRAALLRAPAPPTQRLGLVCQMRKIGWACLAEDPARYFVAGAACRPWQADPGFSPIASEDFLNFVQPDCVKIAWTLETSALGAAKTRFATETRVVATDNAARAKFKTYWRKFGVGIVLIRLVLLPALRRRAEKAWRERQG